MERIVKIGHATAVANEDGAPWFDCVEQACARIVSMDGTLAQVEQVPSNYVVSGRLMTLRAGGKLYQFWLGLNERRMFFIVRSCLDAAAARTMFGFCFGGAAKVGWEMSYEPDIDGVSIWGVCMSSGPLVEEPAATLTSDGRFWATDIAMMAQSWLRTCERRGLVCPQVPPAPL